MAIYRGAGGAGDATNDATSQAILAAQSAQEAAASEAAAASSASSAATSASNAASSATSAASSATSAANSASSATTQAANASSSAATATTKASEAADSATAAASSATAAATSATNASNSATAAANSATSASNSASAASTSATNSATYASNAATSATNAAASETNAAASANSASNSATSATTSATSAGNSASSATTSATNAANSASAAATSATNAATSETNAAGSATSASSSASTATTQATNASNSASAAATSATNAANSATAAASSATDAQSSEDAAAEYAASINPANFLAKANNLSDLTNTSTARTNLGVAIGTNVQAYSSELQAISNGGGNVMFKNRIINGAMMIDQRNAGASVTPTNGQYTVDRWKCYLSQASKFTAQQSSDAPTGFINSTLFTSSSAYTPISTDYFGFVQPIEGLNVSDFAWGTASAKAVTLSFWVKSSLTGTFGGTVYNSSGTRRSYVFSYTISSASTWEYKTVTIPGCTDGTWLTTNGVGILVWFSLGEGSNYLTTPNVWNTSVYDGPTGQTNFVGTNGATFYITGVQLEKGSTATSFDYRPYGTELALCQRYYYKMLNDASWGAGYINSTTQALIVTQLPVTMRVAPSSLETSGTAAHYSLRVNGGQVLCNTIPTLSSSGTCDAITSFPTAGGLTTLSGTISYSQNAAAYLAWSAEL